MGQIFHPSANSLVRAGLGLLVILALLALSSVLLVERSPINTLVGVALSQPVPFSHAHHVQEIGIDCRYCHSTVEDEAFAGVPATERCMHCHSQIWADSPMLAPVRESFATGIPLQWARVHDLPDYVYFNHSIHVSKGIGCSTCHGQLDRMPLTAKAESLNMDWCLACHRHPAPSLRPVGATFDMDWSRNIETPTATGLMERNGVQTQGLTNCSACHR
ncbi:MAG: cytochrome c3 family protein [Phycisphaerales bacterium]|nr:cytochrome c3 family protein [Phycisphaerales bacterium]